MKGKLRVTATGFSSADRPYIEALAKSFGAEYSGELTASVTTHLVCRSLLTAVNTPKYNCALRWGVKVASWKWLVDSAAAGHALPMSHYKDDPHCPLPNLREITNPDVLKAVLAERKQTTLQPMLTSSKDVSSYASETVNNMQRLPAWTVQPTATGFTPGHSHVLGQVPMRVDQPVSLGKTQNTLQEGRQTLQDVSNIGATGKPAQGRDGKDASHDFCFPSMASQPSPKLEGSIPLQLNNHGAPPWQVNSTAEDSKQKPGGQGHAMHQPWMHQKHDVEIPIVQDSVTAGLQQWSLQQAGQQRHGGGALASQHADMMQDDDDDDDSYIIPATQAMDDDEDDVPCNPANRQQETLLSYLAARRGTLAETLQKSLGSVGLAAGVVQQNTNSVMNAQNDHRACEGILKSSGNVRPALASVEHATSGALTSQGKEVVPLFPAGTAAAAASNLAGASVVGPSCSLHVRDGSTGFGSQFHADSPTSHARVQHTQHDPDQELPAGSPMAISPLPVRSMGIGGGYGMIHHDSGGDMSCGSTPVLSKGTPLGIASPRTADLDAMLISPAPDAMHARNGRAQHAQHGTKLDMDSAHDTDGDGCMGREQNMRKAPEASMNAFAPGRTSSVPSIADGGTSSNNDGSSPTVSLTVLSSESPSASHGSSSNSGSSGGPSVLYSGFGSDLGAVDHADLDNVASAGSGSASAALPDQDLHVTRRNRGKVSQQVQVQLQFDAAAGSTGAVNPCLINPASPAQQSNMDDYSLRDIDFGTDIDGGHPTVPDVNTVRSTMATPCSGRAASTQHAQHSSPSIHVADQLESAGGLSFASASSGPSQSLVARGGVPIVEGGATGSNRVHSLVLAPHASQQARQSISKGSAAQSSRQQDTLTAVAAATAEQMPVVSSVQRHARSALMGAIVAARGQPVQRLGTDSANLAADNITTQGESTSVAVAAVHEHDDSKMQLGGRQAQPVQVKKPTQSLSRALGEASLQGKAQRSYPAPECQPIHASAGAVKGGPSNQAPPRSDGSSSGATNLQGQSGWVARQLAKYKTGAAPVAHTSSQQPDTQGTAQQTTSKVSLPPPPPPQSRPADSQGQQQSLVKQALSKFGAQSGRHVVGTEQHDTAESARGQVDTHGQHLDDVCMDQDRPSATDSKTAVEYNMQAGHKLKRLQRAIPAVQPPPATPQGPALQPGLHHIPTLQAPEEDMACLEDDDVDMDDAAPTFNLLTRPSNPSSARRKLQANTTSSRQSSGAQAAQSTPSASVGVYIKPEPGLEYEAGARVTGIVQPETHTDNPDSYADLEDDTERQDTRQNTAQDRINKHHHASSASGIKQEPGNELDHNGNRNPFHKFAAGGMKTGSNVNAAARANSASTAAGIPSSGGANSRAGNAAASLKNSGGSAGVQRASKQAAGAAIMQIGGPDVVGLLQNTVLTALAACKAQNAAGDVVVEVIKALARPPRSSTAKAAHALASASHAKFAEQVQVQIPGLPDALLMVARDRSKRITCPVLWRPFNPSPDRQPGQGDGRWVVAEPSTFYRLPNGGWWMEYHELSTVPRATSHAADLGHDLAAELAGMDVYPGREVIRDVCRQHCRFCDIVGQVMVSKSKRFKASPLGFTAAQVEAFGTQDFKALSSIELHQKLEWDSSNGQVVVKEAAAAAGIDD